MILGKLKAWGLIFAGFVVTALSFLLLKEQRDSARAAAKKYRKQAEHAATVAKEDNEIEADITSRRAEAVKEIRESGHSDFLANPNDDWLRDDETD